MRIRIGASRMLVCLAATATLFASGCNGSNTPVSTAEQTSQHALDAAIVPNADFVVRIDVNAIRQAPVIKQLENAKGNAVGSNPEYEKFQQVTGLSKDDVQAVVLSANTANFDFANGKAQTNLTQMNGVAAVEFAKPLTTDKLIEGLKIILEEKATLSTFDLEGTQAVHIQSTKPDEPSAYAAPARDAKTVYIAFNKASLQAALQRAAKGVMAASRPELQTLSEPASQASLAFTAPQALRDYIQTRLSTSQKSPGNAMLNGFLAPFKNLRSIALGMQWDTDMQIDIAGNLGAADAATQVAALIQTMALPMLKQYTAKASGKSALNLDEQFSVSTEDTALRISLRFTGEDLQAYRKAKEQAKTAALSHQQ